MAKYDEENPIISFRTKKKILEKFDLHLERRKETRQDYLGKLFMDDLRKKEIIEVVIK